MGSDTTELITLLLLGGAAYYLLSSGALDNFISNLGGGSGGAASSFTFNVVGDIDHNKPTGDALCGDNPSLALIIGDFAYDCNADKWWKGTMSACNGKNVIASVGNHDCDGKGFIDLFPLNGGKWEFIHKRGNIAFIAVNTGYCNNECSDPKTSKSLFDQAQNDPSVKWIIVHQHKPIFTAGVSPDAPMSYHTMYKKYSKVKFVFAGHNHTYKRYTVQDGIRYITCGQGGHAGNNSDSQVGPSTGRIGVVKCSVGLDGSISCKYVASSDGKVLDTFGMSSGGNHTGSGGVEPSQNASSSYARSLYNTRLPPRYIPIKEEIDNAIIAEMDKEYARRRKKR